MDKNILLNLYRQMVLARMFEEKVAELYIKGHIIGFCHLYIGQEAVVVGISHNMQSQDSSITSYRDHAHMLTIGVSPNVIMAELCGKSTGCSKGKGGSMHMYCKEKRFFGGNGIVGAQVSLGTGLAFAHNYTNDGGIAITYFGDGAANQGQVAESFNMASIWNLPVLYVLENNRYAMGTAIHKTTPKNSLQNRGASFDIETILVDGMDLLDVIKKSKEAIDIVRTKSKPIILHIDTYRYRGHSMSDPCTYRSRSEVEDIKKNRDPIKNIEVKLSNIYNVKKEEFEFIENEIFEIIFKAEQFALNSPDQNINELTTDVIL